MGMDVLISDPFIKEIDLSLNIYGAKDVKLTVRLRSQSLEAVLQGAHFVTLHTPSIGKALIGKDEIEMMKDGAILINCARGGIIDEDVLLDALNRGKIGGAGLDTFKGEPNPRAELLNHPRVSVSPHIGAATVEAQSNIALELADKIIAYFGDDK